MVDPWTWGSLESKVFLAYEFMHGVQIVARDHEVVKSEAMQDTRACWQQWLAKQE